MPRKRARCEGNSDKKVSSIVIFIIIVMMIIVMFIIIITIMFMMIIVKMMMMIASNQPKPLTGETLPALRQEISARLSFPHTSFVLAGKIRGKRKEFLANIRIMR